MKTLPQSVYNTRNAKHGQPVLLDPALYSVQVLYLDGYSHWIPCGPVYYGNGCLLTLAMGQLYPGEQRQTYAVLVESSITCLLVHYHILFSSGNSHSI